VANGQLEFINAGWSMHDEAGPIYDDMIDNMMVGQQFIKDTFGVAPRVGW
jgi:alpha-mannosidase